MGSLFRLAPGQGVEPVVDGNIHQLVPSGVEIDDIDTVTKAIVRAQERRVVVGRLTELDCRTTGDGTDSFSAFACPASSLALQGIDEIVVFRENVVVGQGRCLIGDLVCR